MSSEKSKSKQLMAPAGLVSESKQLVAPAGLVSELNAQQHSRRNRRFKLQLALQVQMAN